MIDQHDSATSICPDLVELSGFLAGEIQEDTTAIEAHVETCHDCQQQLARLTSADDLALPSEQLPEYLSSFSGDAKLQRDAPEVLPHLPGFEVTEVLGRGGMGVVYRARHERLNREVALKVIASGVHANNEYRERLHREGQVVAKLDHPNILRIFDSGEHEGIPYLVLECVDSGSLDRLRGKIQDPDTIAKLVEILARALDVAHRAGIVHRDLKPANILLSKSDVSDGPSNSIVLDGQSITPRIADFGLSKDTSDRTALVNSIGIAGTPGYMAPEQVNEDHSAIGRAADIHALGVILYELLCGVRPFDGRTHLTTLHNISNQKPKPLSHHRRDVPPTLEAICLRCLEKQPQDRYASAAVLADDLQKYRQGRPLSPAPRAVGSGWRTGRRIATAVAFAFVVFLLFVVIRIQTNRGTVMIDCHDPNLVFEILRNKKSVEKLTVSDGPVRKSVFAGDIEIVIPGAHAETWSVSEQRFELKRGEEKLITIKRVPDQSVPPKAHPEAGPGETERSIATWLMKLGASMQFDTGPDFHPPRTALPSGGFHVTGFRNSRAVQFTPESLEAISQLSKLQVAGLGYGKSNGDGLHHFNKLTNLKHLDLYGNPIRDQYFLQFNNYSKLRSLSLGDTQITSRFLPRLLQAKELSTLRVSDLHLLHPEATEILTQLVALKHLDVYHTTNESMGVAGALPNLTTLNIYHGNLVTDQGLKSIAKYPRLQRLTFHMTNLRGCDLSLLSTMPKLIRVEFLHCGLETDEIASFAESVPNCDVLHSAERDVETLVHAMGGQTVSRTTGRRKTIRPMNYRDMEVDEIHLSGVKELRNEHFDAFRFLQHLKVLHVRDCPVSGAGLANITHLRTLHDLSLRGSKVTDAAMPFVAQVPQLKSLSLALTNVTPEGLAALENQAHLTTLELSGRQLSADVSAVSLARVPKLSELRLIEVHDTAINRIRDLNVDSLSIDESVGVTDDGFNTISKMHPLRKLTIGRHSATTKAVKSLSQMTQLRKLTLPEKWLSAPNIEQLRSALPDCHITIAN